jgi:hypothetical protein
MASSSDEQPKPPEPPAAAVAVATTAVPQSHAEWAASMQAFYAAGGNPYAAWPAQVRRQGPNFGRGGETREGFLTLLCFSAPHGGGGGLRGSLRHAGALPHVPPGGRHGLLCARVHGRG